MGINPFFKNIFIINLPPWKSFCDCKSSSRLKAYGPEGWVSQGPALINLRKKNVYLGWTSTFPEVGNINHNQPVHRGYRCSWTKQCPGWHRALQRAIRSPVTTARRSQCQDKGFVVLCPVVTSLTWGAWTHPPSTRMFFEEVSFCSIFNHCFMNNHICANKNKSLDHCFKRS